MRKKLIVSLATTLLLCAFGHGQDSTRTRNDKPGTPQSLRTADQSPRSHVNIINNTTPGRRTVHETPENNRVNNTGQTIVTNTDDKPVPTTPITIVNTPPAPPDSSTNNSAIKNGISNTSNPTRNQ